MHFLSSYQRGRKLNVYESLMLRVPLWNEDKFLNVSVKQSLRASLWCIGNRVCSFKWDAQGKKNTAKEKNKP